MSLTLGQKPWFLSLNPYCSGRKNRISLRGKTNNCLPSVLILIVVEERIGFGIKFDGEPIPYIVLILIVVEERIGYHIANLAKEYTRSSLNPYCSGRKNRIMEQIILYNVERIRLNPYCSGRKNRIDMRTFNQLLKAVS